MSILGWWKRFSTSCSTRHSSCSSLTFWQKTKSIYNQKSEPKDDHGFVMLNHHSLDLLFFVFVEGLENKTAYKSIRANSNKR
jgi:hypothetical protein